MNSKEKKMFIRLEPKKLNDLTVIEFSELIEFIYKHKINPRIEATFKDGNIDIKIKTNLDEK